MSPGGVWLRARWQLSIHDSELRREVRPAEQHIHSFLESMPFMAVSALLCLHWDQVVRARRSGFSDRAAWVLRPRNPRLPGRYLAGMLAGVALFIGAPYAEELMRCLRRRGGA